MPDRKFINEYQDILKSACLVEEKALQLNRSPENLNLIDTLLPEASHTVILIRGLYHKMFFETAPAKDVIEQTK